jgi:hypothetical protein
MPIDASIPRRPAPAGPGFTRSDTVIIEPAELELLSWTPSEPESAADEAVEPVDAGGADDPEVEQDLAPEVAPPEADEILPAAAAPVVTGEDFPWGNRGSSIFSDSDELERTILVPRREQGERFVLQFSTGESVTVHGSGLLGRNPIPQPGEFFDHLVTISDPGKSVSKTHLEFGQEGGAFWVSDRFSGNGSVVREPESQPRRLTAGKRYRVVRGTRVDIAEQFFIVS